MRILERRAFLRGAGLASAGLCLSGCAPSLGIIDHPPEVLRQPPRMSPALQVMYGPLPDERFPVPEVDLEEVDEASLRRIVPYRTAEHPGTLIIDTRERALFLVMEQGEALRYGVGVGKEGLAWSGRAEVGRKAEWPRWTPTRDMIAREPERNAPWAGGMPPGLQNPLGARALYLHRNGVDSLYRIHGTNEPWSIGQSVSSGCIRMINQDVIDLYRRVPLGTPVIVKL